MGQWCAAPILGFGKNSVTKAVLIGFNNAYLQPLISATFPGVIARAYPFAPICF
jgi:hypothetical protein